MVSRPRCLARARAVPAGASRGESRSRRCWSATLPDWITVKNHAQLIEAFAILRRQAANAVLVIAGDGRCAAGLESQAARMGVADGVRFLGETRDVAALYRELDVCVLNSHAEGTSITLLESNGDRGLRGGYRRGRDARLARPKVGSGAWFRRRSARARDGDPRAIAGRARPPPARRGRPARGACEYTATRQWCVATSANTGSPSSHRHGRRRLRPAGDGGSAVMCGIAGGGAREGRRRVPHDAHRRRRAAHYGDPPSPAGRSFATAVPRGCSGCPYSRS